MFLQDSGVDEGFELASLNSEFRLRWEHEDVDITHK